MVEKRYVSAAETAKLVRQALKESFPGIKFSVQTDTYSMGATVRVSWDDGPTRMQVEAVARAFDGTYFDGMIDYAGSKYHLLDGEVVHFYPSVACNRGAGPLAEKWKLAWAQTSCNERIAYFKATGISAHSVAGDVEDPERCWWPAWHAFSHWEGDPKPSPTFDRVKPYGDDGYGEGTVGTPEHPAVKPSILRWAEGDPNYDEDPGSFLGAARRGREVFALNRLLTEAKKGRPN